MLTRGAAGTSERGWAEVAIAEAEADIVRLRQQLEEERKIREYKLQYNAEAQKILKLADRASSQLYEGTGEKRGRGGWDAGTESGKGQGRKEERGRGGKEAADSAGAHDPSLPSCLLALLPSCPLAVLPSCLLALLPSCPLTLLPSCPLARRSPSLIVLCARPLARPPSLRSTPSAR